MTFFKFEKEALRFINHKSFPVLALSLEQTYKMDFGYELVKN